MADCSKLFGDFNDEISIPTLKSDRMKKSKEALREKVRKYFKDNHSDYEPKFYIQGSYKMKSAVRTKDDICDLDDGVYFFCEPDVTATTLQKWVKEAVEGHTSTSPEHRQKCIRNIFVKDYEIDMPVYYKVDGEDYKLAIKNTGWKDDDPKAMVSWFNNKKDTDNQLVNIVKELKAWCDNMSFKMPSGLAMTILAANAKDKFYYGKRNDINLKDTLKEIKKALDYDFACTVPVTPNDNLFVDYDGNNFLSALDDFINNAEEALKEQNELKASELWRKHLGTRFPLGEDKEANSARNASLLAGGASSNPFSY
ncbi:hypothetical protein AAKU52_003203 [Pedobacter sp. CG_S7]|uniref:CBASS cGAMP synthase n=1 Tax=Pedobacter sp. CG_S7 TaxID=3143930 RepID=UPI003399A0FB